MKSKVLIFAGLAVALAASEPAAASGLLRRQPPLQRLWSEAAVAQPDTPEAALARCQDLFRSGVYTFAREECLRAIELLSISAFVDPRQIPLQMITGAVYYKLGQFGEAAYHFCIAVSIQDDHPSAEALYGCGIAKQASHVRESDRDRQERENLLSRPLPECGADPDCPQAPRRADRVFRKSDQKQPDNGAAEIAAARRLSPTIEEDFRRKYGLSPIQIRPVHKEVWSIQSAYSPT